MGRDPAAQRIAALNAAPSFWDWSLETYRRSGVEETLLSLQDERELNVNLVLWTLWCGRHFESPPEAVLRKARELVRSWTGEIVAPIRRARGALKTPPREAEGAAKLRERIKEIELAAERIEQGMLEALARTNLAPAADQIGTRRRARRNLAAYVAMTGAARTAGFSVALLDDLIERIFPASGFDD